MAHLGHEFVFVILGAGIVIYYLFLEAFEMFSKLFYHLLVAECHGMVALFDGSHEFLQVCRQ